MSFRVAGPIAKETSIQNITEKGGFPEMSLVFVHSRLCNHARALCLSP